MNEKRLLLKAKRAEANEKLAALKREGSDIIKQLEKGLSLGLNDEVSNLNMNKIVELTGKLEIIHETIASLKEQIERIEEEL